MKRLNLPLRFITLTELPDNSKEYMVDFWYGTPSGDIEIHTINSKDKQLFLAECVIAAGSKPKGKAIPIIKRLRQVVPA